MEENQKKEQKKQQGQDEVYRDEVEKFTDYLKTGNKDVIKDIDLETLKRVTDDYKLEYSDRDWYKAMEERIQELGKSST